MRTASPSLVQDQVEQLPIESSEMQGKEEVEHTEAPVTRESEFDSSEKKDVNELEMKEDVKESFSLEPTTSLEPPSLVQRRSITLRLSIVDVVALDLDLATILSARLQQSSASRRNSLVDSGVGIPGETKAALPTPHNASKPMSVMGVDTAMSLFNRFRKEASAACSGVSNALGSKREVMGTKVETPREHGSRGTTDGEDSIFEMVQSTLRRRFTITSQSQAGGGVTPSKDTKGRKVRGKELLQPLRKTLKRIAVFPTHKHTLSKACPSDRSLAETCACAPSTPFLLMTQMDMGGIHRPGRRDADTESYMVISEDNAVLDVLPMSMNSSDETVAPTGANGGGLCRRKSLVKATCAVRTFLTFGGGKTGMSTATSDRSSFSEDEDAGSSDDTDTDTDTDVPSIQTVSPGRRGRDPPFPIRPIISRRLSGTVPSTSVVVPATYTYTYMPPIYPVAEEELEESDTDSMSVYSDDISVCD
ncbi:hypothetical protein EYR36_002126 [Pleurotus pulmonarius]|nr:hypothetical protein EYR36_002126 [Pleurotus pulmonarius]